MNTSETTPLLSGRNLVRQNLENSNSPWNGISRAPVEAVVEVDAQLVPSGDGYHTQVGENNDIPKDAKGFSELRKKLKYVMVALSIGVSRRNQELFSQFY